MRDPTELGESRPLEAAEPQEEAGAGKRGLITWNGDQGRKCLRGRLRAHEAMRACFAGGRPHPRASMGYPPGQCRPAG